MSNVEDTFRLLLLIVFVVLMPFGLYRRLQSHTGETLDRWQEGLLILFGLRLAALFLAAGGLAWLIEPGWMAWSEVAIPIWLRWTGLAAVGLGGSLLTWTFHCLGGNLTDTVVTRKEHSLVTTGPYRWVRHPFYTACAVAIVGGGLVTANWFVFLMGFSVVALLVARTRIEEKKLVERFGDEYRAFSQRTGRFVPRFWR